MKKHYRPRASVPPSSHTILVVEMLTAVGMVLSLIVLFFLLPFSRSFMLGICAVLILY